MNSNTKSVLLSLLVFILIYIGTHTLFKIYYNIQNTIILSVISAVSAWLFSPRQIRLNKQSGKEIHLKWLFSKKVIRFK